MGGMPLIGGMMSPSEGRKDALDGLRGVAILFVALHHFNLHLPSWLDWGPVAPNVFFLISGYLITQSLFRMKADGQASVGGILLFHLRRFIRLAPALYLMLATGFFLGLAEFQEGLWWHFGFLSNFKMALDGEWPGMLSHLWSLAVQEQFYLLWPLILLLPVSWMPWLLGGAFVGAGLFRAWCVASGASEFVRWFMLPASLDAFAAGGFVAYLAAVRGPERILPERWLGFAACAAVSCWIGSRYLREFYDLQPLATAFVDNFESFVFAWVLLVVVAKRRAMLSRVLSFGPLALLGRISYGVFVWHILIFYAFSPILAWCGLGGETSLAVRFVILMAITAGLAFLSWTALEQPFIAWSRRLCASNGVLALWWSRIAR